MAKKYYDDEGYYENDEPRFEDVSSYSSSKEYKKKRKNKRGKTIAKSIIGVFCALLIVFGAGLIYIATNVVDELEVVPFPKDVDILNAANPVITDNSIKNIALFGLDTRTNSFSGQSDAIMILSIDNLHKKIKMTSVLRDSFVGDMDGVGAARINAAYAYGGAELAVKTLNQCFQLDIMDYVAINFVQLTKLVNAFGGTVVEITEDEAIEINKNLTMLQYEHEDASSSVTDADYIEETGGVKLLNGAQALAYARIRKIDTDSERSNRQKKVIFGLLERFKEMPVTDYPNMIRTTLGMCQTSLNFDDIFSLLPAATGGYAQESVNIPGDYERPWEGRDWNYANGPWYYHYDFERAAEHVSTFIYEELSPYYNPAMGNGADQDEILPSGYAKTYNFFDDEDTYYYSYDGGIAPEGADDISEPTDDWMPSESDTSDPYSGPDEGDPYSEPEDPYSEPEDPYSEPEDPYSEPDAGGEGITFG